MRAANASRAIESARELAISELARRNCSRCWSACSCKTIVRLRIGVLSSQIPAASDLVQLCNQIHALELKVQVAVSETPKPEVFRFSAPLFVGQLDGMVQIGVI